MNDEQLRELVRRAIVRQLADPTGAAAAGASPAPAFHPSHALYQIVNTTEACLIEPAVPCSHCNYCRSHGH